METIPIAAPIAIPIPSPVKSKESELSDLDIDSIVDSFSEDRVSFLVSLSKSEGVLSAIMMSIF